MRQVITDEIMAIKEREVNDAKQILVGAASRLSEYGAAMNAKSLQKIIASLEKWQSSKAR